MNDSNISDDQHDDDNGDAAALNRRRLLKAAVGGGIALGAYAAPKVSGVPAYAATATNPPPTTTTTPPTTTTLPPPPTDSECYAITFSSNAPTSKGWMELGSQNEVGGNVRGPDIGPDSDQGQGTAVYRWNNVGPFGTQPAFQLTLTASGCANNGNGRMTFTGLPTGYCIIAYNSGQATTEKADSCGGAQGGLLTSRYRLATSGDGDYIYNNGEQITIQNSGGACDGGTNGEGKVTWAFDVVLC